LIGHDYPFGVTGGSGGGDGRSGGGTVGTSIGGVSIILFRSNKIVEELRGRPSERN
jgi:hypothetical protein